MADTVQALAALRDANRFLHVSLLTHARELFDGQVARGGPKYASKNEEDAVVAQQEVREGIDRIAAAVGMLADGEPRETLTAALRRDDMQQRLPTRAVALQQAIRAAYPALLAAAPGQPGLQVWGADEEDRAIARAAGMGVRPLHVVIGAVVVSAAIAWLVMLAR